MRDSERIIHQVINDYWESAKNRDQNFHNKYLDEKTQFFRIGSAQDEISRSKVQFIENDKKSWGDAIFSQLEFIVENAVQIDSIIFGLVRGRTSFRKTEANISYTNEGFRISVVLQKTKNGLRIRQWHVSIPEHGVEPGEIQKSTSGIQIQINEWIKHFQLSSTVINEKEKLIQYLKNAQSLLTTNKG